jgi:MFS family permease
MLREQASCGRLQLMSHGTQDYFPTFLEDDFGAGHTTITIVAIIYNVGALIGGMYFGALSQRFWPAADDHAVRRAGRARRAAVRLHSPSFALLVVIVPVLVTVIVLTALGSEAHSARFGGADDEAREPFTTDRFTREGAPAAQRLRT